MATAELVILSSSPYCPPSAHGGSTPPHAQRVVLNSSSPLSDELPSFTSIWRNGGIDGLRSGSKAEPLPKGALTGFSSAASLVNNGILGLDNAVDSDSPKSIPPEKAARIDASSGSKKRKRAPVRPRANGKEAIKKSAHKGEQPEDVDLRSTREIRHNKNSFTENPLMAGGETSLIDAERNSADLDLESNKNQRKPRKPPKNTAGKGKEIKTRKRRKCISVEDPDEAPSDPSRVFVSVTSKHFDANSQVPASNYTGYNEGEQPPIRVENSDGDPVQNGAPKSIRAAICNDLKTADLSATIMDRIDAAQKEASNTIDPSILETSSNTENQKPSNEASKKKGRAAKSSKAKSSKPKTAERVKQPKAPKKKALTITGLATSPFKKPAPPAAVSTNSVMSPQLESEHVQLPPPEEDTKGQNDKGKAAEKTKKTRTPRQRSPTKREPKSRKGTKKREVELPKLLSPQSAISQLNQQDILFGTSSQLIREESPAHIRGLQTAIHDSELTSTTVHTTILKNSKGIKRLSAMLPMGKPGIWGAAARDSQEQLFHNISEDYNLGAQDKSPTDGRRRSSDEQLSEFVPNPDCNLSLENIKLVGSAQDEHAQLGEKSVEYLSIDDFDTKKQEASDKTGVFAHINEFETGSINSSVKNMQTPPRRLVHRLTLSPTQDNRSKVVSSYQRPVLGSLPTNAAIVSPRTASNKARSPHSRVSPNKSVSQSLSEDLSGVLKTPKRTQKNLPRHIAVEQRSGQDADASENGAETLKSKPSTPKRKKVKNKWVHIDDIEDSEVEVATITTPRRQKGQNAISEPPRELEFSPSQSSTEITYLSAEKGNSIGWETAKARLFPKITRALKTAPRTRDPRKPSWYEKMLLYDPIVIEDLTAWLNEQNVKADWKNERQELSPWMVQKWCEENSVCCLWKSGLRGGVRARY